MEDQAVEASMSKDSELPDKLEGLSMAPGFLGAKRNKGVVAVELDRSSHYVVGEPKKGATIAYICSVVLKSQVPGVIFHTILLLSLFLLRNSLCVAVGHHCWGFSRLNIEYVSQVLRPNQTAQNKRSGRHIHQWTQFSSFVQLCL